VVLCHGGPGLWDYLADLAALLGDGHTLVRFDRGRGWRGSELRCRLGVMVDQEQMAAVVAEARGQDAALTADVAELLARAALVHLTAEGAADAPALARRLIAEHASVGVSAANVVAVAAMATYGS